MIIFCQTFINMSNNKKEKKNIVQIWAENDASTYNKNLKLSSFIQKQKILCEFCCDNILILIHLT